MTPDIAPGRIDDARSAALQLLERRTDQMTICPSEIARMIAAEAGADHKGASWRAAMPVVHAAIDQLVADGSVELSWKGKVLASRQGPYRIRRLRSGR
ncbi:DUF3253 domain-containing protein (plasmid) [Sphingobium yanoikuyae]|nr:DUF3253 domain-containing protein [Sphingobium yanoikuyae]WBQ19138.1 DUF3253 domain-containing protein [Sphingobium yanoikuyae]